LHHAGERVVLIDRSGKDLVTELALHGHFIEPVTSLGESRARHEFSEHTDSIAGTIVVLGYWQKAFIKAENSRR
jgi:hypothetical protein